ncbi:retrovirus-related pol polyprotein from transposon TNT 1-94 [Tanacetum coccineum]
MKKRNLLSLQTPFVNWLSSLLYCPGLSSSPDDEEVYKMAAVVKSSLNDLEERISSMSALAKSKRFFKKGTQRFSSAKKTDQTECHKCGKKGYFARDCFSKTSIHSYQSLLQTKLLSSSHHKPEVRPTKDFEAKCSKVKAKLALLSLSASASNASMLRCRFIAKAFEWDEEEYHTDDNEMLNLKSKSIFKAEALNDVIINEPSSAPTKGNKSASALKVNSAPAGKLKNVKIEDDPPLAMCERTDHRTCNHAEYMSTMNMSQHLKGQGGSSSRSRTPRPLKHFFTQCIHYGFSDYLSDDCVNYPICNICGSYDHDTHVHNRIISLRRGIKPRNPQHVMKSCETCGSTVHTITDHNDIEWFRRGEALQAMKAEALKSTKAESSNANRSKTSTKRKPIWYLDNRCSRHMTGVKSYLHKYVEQPGPKKRGTISNSNKEVVMIASRVRYVYVIDMTSSAQESCFFAKASDNLNWLWHNRLAHLKFKTINKLANQNLVIGLPSLVYSKDKPCSSCEKEKHHRASFKTK